MIVFILSLGLIDHLAPSECENITGAKVAAHGPGAGTQEEAIREKIGILEAEREQSKNGSPAADKELDVLEAATNELETMTLQAAQHVIDQKLYTQLGIPELAIPLIESSWEAEPPSLYGRLDFAYDGPNPPKLLEYNADTPTSLVEAAVVQWYWLQDCFPTRDQFNSLHERLAALCKNWGSFFRGGVSTCVRWTMPGTE